MSDTANVGVAPAAPNAVPVTPAMAFKPRILDQMAADLKRSGLAGEERAAKLIYLVGTSRFLARPLCAAIKAQSSAGKSTVSGRVLALFPPSACVTYTSISAKHILYDEEPLSHRILVLAEAAGLGDGVGAYLVRSLVSEGRVTHGTVTPKEGGGHQSAKLEKEGPTGLLVTTTALSLDDELETRLLSIPIDDSAAQTSAVIEAIFGEAVATVPLDPTPWHELHDWLAGAEHRVTIPYGTQLARRLPPAAVRMRRDAMALKTLIETHALLHQAQRQRDDRGKIIATLDDYAAVYELVSDLIAEGVGAIVKPEVRQTVEAARALGATNTQPVRLSKIRERLQLDKGTVSRRVAKCIEGGYLLNPFNTTRVSAVTLGEPLPDERPVLPEPALLVA